MNFFSGLHERIFGTPEELLLECASYCVKFKKLLKRHQNCVLYDIRQHARQSFIYEKCREEASTPIKLAVGPPEENER